MVDFATSARRAAVVEGGSGSMSAGWKATLQERCQYDVPVEVEHTLRAPRALVFGGCTRGFTERVASFEARGESCTTWTDNRLPLNDLDI